MNGSINWFGLAIFAYLCWRLWSVWSRPGRRIQKALLLVIVVFFTAIMLWNLFASRLMPA